LGISQVFSLSQTAHGSSSRKLRTRNEKQMEKGGDRGKMKEGEKIHYVRQKRLNN